MDDKETEFLSRFAANHIFFGHYEPFRATIRSLRSQNSDLAKTVLQTVVCLSGHFPDHVLWSYSRPSPAILTFLSTHELLQFLDPTLGFRSFDPDMLKLRAEFLLYVHIIISRVSGNTKDGVNREGNRVSDVGSKNYEELTVFERVAEV